MLFLLKYIKYYQIGQIGVGPCTDLQQIGMNDMEWLTSIKWSYTQYKNLIGFDTEANQGMTEGLGKDEMLASWIWNRFPVGGRAFNLIYQELH